MEGLLVTLELYWLATTRAARLASKNWPVLGSVLAYWFIMSLAVQFGALLGLLGGVLVSLVWAACIGSFLYLVEMMVRTSKVTLGDFRRSFGVYLWDVVGVTFVLWVFWRLAGPALAQLPQGGVIIICLNISIFVFLNAVPELIYLGHHSLPALLSESYRFVAENWIEWFPPNVLMVVILALLWGLPLSGAGRLIQGGVVALFLYFAMVMRGLLFLELSGTTQRGRIFRRRMER